MKAKDILNSLGIPENNKGLSLQEIIDSVLKKNHPEAPEVSDVSNTKLSVIDDSKKAVITLINMEAPPFYSNIVVMAAKEQEDFNKSLFRKINYNMMIRHLIVSADFYIPVNEKIESENYTNFFNQNLDQYEKIDAVVILLNLISITKGVTSVTVNDGKSAETVTIYDLLNFIQSN